MVYMKSKTQSGPIFSSVGCLTPSYRDHGVWCASALAAITMFLLATALCSPVANAQTTIEVEKITCAQFVTFSVADPNQIGLWLSGYFHGRHGDKVLRVQELRKNVDALKKACYLLENAELSVMEVSESLFPNK